MVCAEVRRGTAAGDTCGRSPCSRHTIKTSCCCLSITDSVQTSLNFFLKRADASTEWKEFTTTEGRKYYYNKVTKQSKWTIPDDLKLAREQVEKATAQSEVTKTRGAFIAPVASTGLPERPFLATSNILVPSTVSAAASSPVQGTTVYPIFPPVASEPLSVGTMFSTGIPISPVGTPNVIGSSSLNLPVIPFSAPVTANEALSSVSMDGTTITHVNHDSLFVPNNASGPDGASALDLEVVITKCFHLFCNPYIQRNLEIHHRKCPGCGTPSNKVTSVRNSFCTGQLLEHSQYEFSPPTSAGKAFVCSYNNMKSFLVYMT